MNIRSRVGYLSGRNLDGLSRYVRAPNDAHRTYRLKPCLTAIRREPGNWRLQP